MRAPLFACAWLTWTVAAGCSGDHTGIPATAPFDPIGSEPASVDSGAPAAGGVFALLCAQACANINAACRDPSSASYCMPQCTMSLVNYAGCEAQDVAYTVCLATTDLDCVYGVYRAPACEGAYQVLIECLSLRPPTP